MTKRGRLVPLALFALLSGCGSDALSPVAKDAPPIVDAGVDSPDASIEDGGEPPPSKRTVLQRNPFGNVAESENLLWDGDFEWSSPFSDQYGWLAGPPLSYAFSGVQIGAVCRSGIKCVSVKKGKIVVGIGVSSRDSALLASFWMKPSDGLCADLDAALIGLTSNGDPEVSIGPTSETADDSGWCHFEALADVRVEKTYLYVKNLSQGEILLDDAVLKAVDTEAMKASSFAQSLLIGPPTAAHAADIADVRADLRRLRGPHDPPPNAAKRAFMKRAKP